MSTRDPRIMPHLKLQPRRRLTLEQVGIAVSSVLTIGAFVFVCWDKIEHARTELLAGRVVKICRLQEQDKPSDVAQTILWYKACNPGPAKLENVKLRVVVRHQREERIEEWLEATALGAAEWTLNSSGQHTVYIVTPDPKGNVVELDPGASFGIQLVAAKDRWEPDEVRASWGTCREMSAKHELQLGPPLRSSWVDGIVPCVVFVVGLVFLVFSIVRSWIMRRTSTEFVQLQQQIQQLDGKVILALTDPDRFRDAGDPALKMLQHKAQEASSDTAV